MGDKGSKTKTDVKLSGEAQGVLNKELQLFLSNFVPAQMNQQGRVLQTIGPGGEKGGMAGSLSRALGTSEKATEAAGGQYGISPEDIATVLSGMEESEPEMVNALINMFRNYATSTDSLVDPRWAQFLAPTLTQKTSPGSGQVAGNAAGLAVGVAGAAIAI